MYWIVALKKCIFKANAHFYRSFMHEVVRFGRLRTRKTANVRVMWQKCWCDKSINVTNVPMWQKCSCDKMFMWQKCWCDKCADVTKVLVWKKQYDVDMRTPGRFLVCRNLHNTTFDSLCAQIYNVFTLSFMNREAELFYINFF